MAFTWPISSADLPSIDKLPSNVFQAFVELVSSVAIPATPFLMLPSAPVNALPMMFAPSIDLNMLPVLPTEPVRPSSRAFRPRVSLRACCPSIDTCIVTLPSAIGSPPFYSLGNSYNFCSLRIRSRSFLSLVSDGFQLLISMTFDSLVLSGRPARRALNLRQDKTPCCSIKSSP